MALARNGPNGRKANGKAVVVEVWIKSGGGMPREGLSARLRLELIYREEM